MASLDWAAVSAALRRVHEVTGGWPQRPGFAATRELLTAGRGGELPASDVRPPAGRRPASAVLPRYCR